jgi:RNA polymerase sigma factor (sigma-70 family)
MKTTPTIEPSKPTVKNKTPKSKQDDSELFSRYASLLSQEKKLLEEEQPLPKDLIREKTKVRNQLVEKNQALVSYMINKYYNKAEHKKIKEDLVQEGIIGLMSAIDGFDQSLGFRFSTYSTWWIRQAINTYLADTEPTIHVPTHIRTAQNKLLKNMSLSGQPFGKDFNGRFYEESKALDYTPKMVNSIRSALMSKGVSSLDKPMSANNGTLETSKMTWKESLPDNSSPVGQLMDNSTLVDVISKGLKKLSDKNRNVLLLRFNVIDEADVTPNKESSFITEA